MKRYKLWLFMTFLGALTACNSSGFRGNAASDGNAVAGIASGPNAVTDSVQISKNVDVIIALDSSGSMDEERAAVTANLNKLILALQKGSLDPRIHLIAGVEDGDDDAPATPFPFPADVDGRKVALVAEKIDSHDALSHVSQTLSGGYAAQYRDVKGVAMNPPLAFRPEAKLEVLVISDDNGLEAGNTAKDFDPANKWKATVSGVIGTPATVPAEGVCDIDAIGQEYITLAGQTGGTILDICSPDWSVIIDRFTRDVLKRSQSIHLSREPVNPSQILVTLGGNALPASSWTYDPATRFVTLNASVTLTEGQELKANYDAKP